MSLSPPARVFTASSAVKLPSTRSVGILLFEKSTSPLNVVFASTARVFTTATLAAATPVAFNVDVVVAFRIPAEY